MIILDEVPLKRFNTRLPAIVETVCNIAQVAQLVEQWTENPQSVVRFRPQNRPNKTIKNILEYW